MQVVKRNGQKEPIDYEKIHRVIYWATEGCKNTSVSDIEMNAKLRFDDGMKTSDIHNQLIRSTSELISLETPEYELVAGRLLAYKIRKEVFNTSKDMPPLRSVISKECYDPILRDLYSDEELDDLNDAIHHERDFDLTYASMRQILDKYLLQDRTTKQVFETPQFAYMFIAMTLFAHEKKGRIKMVKEFYNLISKQKINLPTPILCGARTKTRQYSSCVLIDVGDNRNSIYSSNTAIGYYTAERAGIGINIGRIRPEGSKIRGGETSHTGLIPFLRMFQDCTKSCTQNGVRGGGSTTYYPFFHPDFEDLIVLKNNRGSENNRVRHMDYGVQLSKLFYQRVLNREHISLFSSHECPDLYEAFGTDAFDDLYVKYENAGKAWKTIPAMSMACSILQERIDTARIYIMNIDHVNSHSSFYDKIYMSNLCAEITLPTKPINHIDDEDGEIATCVLAGVNLGKVTMKEIPKVCWFIVRALDNIIEDQGYPVKAAEVSMKKRRSIGVGVTNLAYLLAKNKCSYGSEESLNICHDYMEAIQYHLVFSSCDLAKERGKCKGSKYNSGILPIDHYHRSSVTDRPLKQDWELLRLDLLEYGIRNSTLTAIMPAESSSVAQNSTNGIEPIRNLLTYKTSKKNSVPMLAPDALKLENYYDTQFALPHGNEGYLKVCAVLQKFVDQSISANNYYGKYQQDEDGDLSMTLLLSDLFTAYKYGIKTLYYANTDDGKEAESSCSGGGCTL